MTTLAADERRAETVSGRPPYRPTNGLARRASLVSGSMPHSRQIVAPILVAAVLTVWGRGADAQRADTIVRNATPKYAGISSLVLEQRIGVVDGPSEYMFAQIFDVLPARNGSLLVLDRGAMELRLFDSTGRFVRTVARRGQGPGEFTAPAGMAFLRDGRLLLYDSGNRRINVYTAAGASETQWTLASSVSTLTRGLVVDTAGFVHYRRSVLTRYPSQHMAGRPLLGTRDFWFRLRSPDGALVDSLGAPDHGPPVEPFFASSSRGWRQMAVPFLPRALNAMSPLGHLVTGFPSRHAFEIQQRAGPVVSVRRNVRPEAVTADERRTARDYIATWDARGQFAGDLASRHSGNEAGVQRPTRCHQAAAWWGAPPGCRGRWWHAGLAP